jgi:hypothetical protein
MAKYYLVTNFSRKKVGTFFGPSNRGLIPGFSVKKKYFFLEFLRDVVPGHQTLKFLFFSRLAPIFWGQKNFQLFFGCTIIQNEALPQDPPPPLI